jgi:predicted methyltransferase
MDLQNRIDKMLNLLPSPNIHNTGQWLFNSQTILRLMVTMIIKGDLEGKKILCLTTPTIAGGIALCKLAKSVYALDIDKDLLEKIRSFVEDNDAKIETVIYDIQEPAIDNLCEQFGCFIVDPLYAIDHYEIVLSRAIQFVGKPDKIGYIVVPPVGIAMTPHGRGEKPLALKVIEIINKMELAIIDFKPQFIEYSIPPAESYIFRRRLEELIFFPDTPSEWRASDMVVVKTTNSTKPKYTTHRNLKTSVFASERCAINPDLVPIKTSVFTDIPCQECEKCFRGFYQIRKEERELSLYFPLEIQIIPLSSWRKKDDKLFVIDDTCYGFVDNREGRIIILKGPASKEAWKIIEDKLKMSARPADKSQFIEEVIRQIGFLHEDVIGRIRDDVPKFLEDLFNNSILNKEDFK